MKVRMLNRKLGNGRTLGSYCTARPRNYTQVCDWNLAYLLERGRVIVFIVQHVGVIAFVVEHGGMAIYVRSWCLLIHVLGLRGCRRNTEGPYYRSH